MKQKSVEIENIKLFFQEYDMNDLVENLEYIDTSITKEQVKKIVTEFFTIMCTDLIKENTCFVLPEKYHGRFLYIRDITNVNHPEYKYDFTTDGKYYKPVIISYKMSGIHTADFIGPMKELFDNEVFNHKHKY